MQTPTPVVMGDLTSLLALRHGLWLHPLCVWFNAEFTKCGTGDLIIQADRHKLIAQTPHKLAHKKAVTIPF